MIKVYCDGCGKQLKNDFEDTVNMDFNCYGTAKFDDRKTYNLCKQCATVVKEFIETLPDAFKKESE